VGQENNIDLKKYSGNGQFISFGQQLKGLAAAKPISLFQSIHFGYFTGV